MNSVRQAQLLQSVTNLARKVYNIVPIQEGWTCNYILSQLNASGDSNASVSAVRACLGDLEDQGLITQKNSRFQRVAVKPAKQVTSLKEIKQVMPTPTVAAKDSNLDLLADLASEVTALNQYMSERLREISNRMETIALAVEEERKANIGASEKLKQLQTLLKGLGD